MRYLLGNEFGLAFLPSGFLLRLATLLRYAIVLQLNLLISPRLPLFWHTF